MHSPRFRAPAHVRLRISLILLGCILPLAASLAAAAGPLSLEAQRAAFIKAYASASNGDPAWKKQARGLKDYPLYPYLEAAALEHDIKSVSLSRVDAYLKRWPGMLPAATLRRDFLRELARRKDWSGFRSLYQPGLGTALRCDKLQARLAAGEYLSFRRDLAGIWQHTTLPDACTPVLDWAHKHHLLTRGRLWRRIDAAAAAGRSDVVASLTRWLHGIDRRRAQHVLLALRHPGQAARAALTWRDSPRSRSTASLALRRLSRRDSKLAVKIWSKLRRHLHFTRAQHLAIEHDLALFSATDFDAGAIRRLRELPAAAQNASTRGWRLRVALARRDWQGVLDAYEAMPVAQQQGEEWRYFHARALAALGHSRSARRIYAKLATQTDYFGFLAADRLHQPYTLCPAHMAGDPARERALLENPGLDRAFELFAVNLPLLARREWNRALAGASSETRRLAALLAYRRGWYNRAIGVFSHGPEMKLYRLRFPLARKDHVAAESRDAGIDPAWAYAIIRAESAWMTDAHSGANAYGLMQLLPRTARRVARRLKLPYHTPVDLFDPGLNIALGTHYLALMAARFDGAPWLATAAYDAGPVQLDKWLAARGSLPPDIFVATMPFHETRDYVARVMAFSVIYDWRLHQRTLPLSRRMPRFGQPYSLPGPDSPRQAVQCPAAHSASETVSAP